MATKIYNQDASFRFLMMAAATIVIIGGLKIATTLIIPFLIAVFLAILCAPAVFWLQRRKMPSVVAVLLVVVVLFGVLSGLGAVVGGSVKEFTKSIPQYQQRLDSLSISVTTWVRGLDLPFGLDESFDLDAVDLQEMIQVGAVMSLLGDGLKGLINALSNTLLVTLTLVFILLEAAGLPTKIRAAIGSGDADISRFSKVTTEVQHYLAIKTMLSLVTGVAIAVWMAVLGLDFALVWGLLAFLLNYIPNLGSIIAAVPAVLLALVQLGPGRALLVLLGFVVVNVLIGNVTEPQLMGRRLGMSTLVVFLSLVFWGWIWGPVGMLLSVPLTMIVKIMLENSEDLAWLGVMLDSKAGAEAKLAALTASGQIPAVVPEPSDAKDE